jgi:hypothetical protein
MVRCWLCACLVVSSLSAAGCGGGGGDGDDDHPARKPGPQLTARVARELDAKLREKVEDTGVPGATAAVVFPDGRCGAGARASPC